MLSFGANPAQHSLIVHSEVPPFAVPIRMRVSVSIKPMRPSRFVWSARYLLGRATFFSAAFSWKDYLLRRMDRAGLWGTGASEHCQGPIRGDEPDEAESIRSQCGLLRHLRCCQEISWMQRLKRKLGQSPTARNPHRS